MSLRTTAARAIVLGGLATPLLLALGAQSAWAEASTYCVKATKVTTPKKHYTGGWNDSACTSVNATHEGKYEKLASFSSADEQQLKALLKYVSVQASGVGGKPTVQFSGANVQVVNGEGSTATTNGAGNLVVGYDEHSSGRAQTGSHNLIVGEQQSFTSYGGLVAGSFNVIASPFASVTGGSHNTANGQGASVSGGDSNEAGGESEGERGEDASVSGGRGTGPVPLLSAAAKTTSRASRRRP